MSNKKKNGQSRSRDTGNIGTQDTRRKQTQHRKLNRWATQTPPITDRNITSIYRTCSIFDRNNNIYS